MNAVSRRLVLLLMLSVAIGIPRAASAQYGDLLYERGWQATMINYDYWNTWIDMWMWDNYGPLADDHQAGPTPAVVWAQIPARTVSNTASVQADFWEENPYWGWTFVGSSYDSSGLPGAGPGNVGVFGKAFIKDEWVSHPYWLPLIYGGDDRGFAYSGVTSRISLYAEALNSAIDSGVWNFGPSFNADLSIAYDRDTSLMYGAFGGPLTQAAKDDWTWG